MTGKCHVNVGEYIPVTWIRHGYLSPNVARHFFVLVLRCEDRTWFLAAQKWGIDVMDSHITSKVPCGSI